MPEEKPWRKNWIVDIDPIAFKSSCICDGEKIAFNKLEIVADCGKVSKMKVFIDARTYAHCVLDHRNVEIIITGKLEDQLFEGSLRK